MIRRPFLTFALVVSSLVIALVWFIESSYFTSLLKQIAVQYVPQGIGIRGDFEEVSVQLFPPGFSIKDPKVHLEKENILKLPEGSSVVAESIEFHFLPFQMFSGNVRLHEISIRNGEIQLILNPLTSLKPKKPQTKTQKFELHWDELLQVHTEAVTLQNVTLKVRIPETEQFADAKVSMFKFAQWTGHGGLGYSVRLDLKDAQTNLLRNTPLNLGHIEGVAYLNALGLKLDKLNVSGTGIDLLSSGEIKGNFLDPKDLVSELNLDFQGNIGEILKIALVPTQGSSPVLSKDKLQLQGVVGFQGKVQGNLGKPLETGRLDGVFNARNLIYKEWKVDKARADLAWTASPSGGEIVLKKALIETQEKPRNGGLHPGEGGKIEIGPTRWVVGSRDPIKTLVRLERAHLDWLAAPALKKIYGLDIRVSGTSQTEFVFPRSDPKGWSLDAEVDIDVGTLILDNQRLGKVKPFTSVIQADKVALAGQVHIDPKGIFFPHLSLSLPRSKLKAVGKVDFDTGYDIKVVGTVNLADVPSVAENQILGEGTLNANIHGLPSNTFVDMDFNLKNAVYLKLDLGNLTGRVTWEDDPNLLHFTNIHLVQGFTDYDLNGVIDVENEKVKLDSQISQGDIRDFLHVFKNLVDGISWFPHSLNGPFVGSLSVRGGLHYSKLEVDTQFMGSNWEYMGERAKSVSFSGGYDKGRYFLKDLDLLKRFGKVYGSISLSKDDKLDWDLRSEDFSLTDFDYIAQLDVPIRGKLLLETVGQGKLESLKSHFHADLSHFSIQGRGLPNNYLDLKTEGGVMLVDATLMGGQGSMGLNYNVNPKVTSHLKTEFKQLDFAPILVLLNPKLVQDRSLVGIISGGMDLTFTSAKWDQANGVVNLSEYNLARSNSRIYLPEPYSFKVLNGNFDIEHLALAGKSGDLVLNLKSKEEKLAGDIRGKLDPSILEFVTSDVNQISGETSLDFKISGNLNKPLFRGTSHLRKGSFRLPSLDSPFENVAGTLQVDQNILTLTGMHGELGGGRFTADGKVTVFEDKYPAVALKGSLTNSKLKIFPFQFVKMNGTLGVTGTEPPYVIAGNIAVDSALSKEKVLNRKNTSVGLKSLQYGPPPTKPGETASSRFKLNITVDAPKGILVQNDLFRDVQAKANLTLVNTVEAPRIVGTAEVLQGKLLFKDHVFQIQTAKANFDSPRVINPTIDLTATTEVNGIKIRLYASGRIDSGKIKIEFTSNPAMAESDILSLIAVGMTAADAKKLSATDLSAMQQGEAASLVLHSLDFNRDIEDKTGFQVQVDESVNAQQGVSAFRPQSQTDSAVAPQITIRRKLGDQLSLSAGSTVGAGTNRSNQVNMDYSIDSDVTLSGVFNNYGTYGTTADTQIIQNSTGLDLKFQKRFK